MEYVGWPWRIRTPAEELPLRRLYHRVLEITAMTAATLFTTEELANAAFDLLTSSTLERYARKAQEAAWGSRLVSKIRENPFLIPQLLDTARRLWRSLLCSVQRDVPEVELALLLSLLARTADPRVDPLLIDLSLIDRGPVTWISALARRLLGERTSNTEQALWQAQPVAMGYMRYETYNSARVTYRLMDHVTVNLKCHEDYASQTDTALAAA
jgi:hypothetical protein